MKIMLVDDMEIANFILKKMMSIVAPEASVYDFINPVMAFEQLKTIQPDYIFLDLSMPELDGWGFLEKMVAENLSFNVVVLTSSSSELDHQKSKEFPFVIDYVIKPMGLTNVKKYIQDPSLQN